MTHSGLLGLADQVAELVAHFFLFLFCFTHSALTLAKLLAQLGITFLFMAGQLTHFGLLYLAELVAHSGFLLRRADKFYDTLYFVLSWCHTQG